MTNNNKIIIYSLSLVLSSLAGVLHAEELMCPVDKQAATLDSWRDKAVSTAINGQYNDVKNKIKECFSDKAPGCLNELIYYVDLKKTNVSGFNMSEEIDLYDPVEGYNLKSVADLPPEFQAKDSNGKAVPDSIKIPPNLFELAKQKGWKAITYKTRSTGGFDMPPNLTLIAIHGADKDIYLQISPHPDRNHRGTNDNPVPQPAVGDATVGQRVLTIISVDKTKTPPIGQLKFLKENDILNNTYGWKKNTNSASCMECHTTPLRTISPIGYRVTNGTEKRMSAEDEKTVTEINDMMIGEVSWGKVKYGDIHINKGPSSDSQPYGWAPPNSETRKEDFIKSCSTQFKYFSYQGFGDYKYDAIMSNQPEINYQKISQAMNCVQCHNNTVRGNLHRKFSWQEIKFKVMVDRSMPPGQDLTNDERIALLNCMSAEFQNVNAAWNKSGDWMKKTECTSVRDAAGPSNRRRSRPAGLQSVTN